MTPHHLQIAAIDIGTVALIIGSFAGYLPPLAAGLAALWYCVLIYDRFFKNSKSDD
jgi:hypothetical protein